MLLDDHPPSSYCQKVKIAMREKGLAFEAVLPRDLGTGQHDIQFASANPPSDTSSPAGPILILPPLIIGMHSMPIAETSSLWPSLRYFIFDHSSVAASVVFVAKREDKASGLQSHPQDSTAIRSPTGIRESAACGPAFTSLHPKNDQSA